jgi:hypothetical protein
MNTSASSPDAEPTSDDSTLRCAPCGPKASLFLNSIFGNQGLSRIVAAMKERTLAAWPRSEAPTTISMGRRE